MHRTAALVLVFATGCEVDDVPLCDPVSGYNEFDVAGRHYGIFVPADIAKAGVDGVALVFHGDAECVLDESDVCSTPPAIDLNGVRSQFDLEGRTNAALVYVVGANKNVFRPDLLSWDTFSDTDNADFAAVDAILDDVRARVCVDDVKVAAVGFSGGAFFAHSLACLHGAIDAVVSFEGGFEAGDVAVSYDEDNIVDVDDCGDLPNALIVAADDDTVVPPEYGDAAFAAYGCDAIEDVDDDCVTACGSVFCTPATADAGANPPRTHGLWIPEGPEIAGRFLDDNL